ncbi:MAG: hypothetical protein HYV96_07950 [Opitutae bacterium]|nr:hypothetical protein [Opitutae bacterium]
MKPFSLLGPCLALVCAVEPTPVLLDTNIGRSIDDAYVRAQLVHNPIVRLLGVTPFSGNTGARTPDPAAVLACVESLFTH